MDHLLLIVLACASIGAWVHAIRRGETPFIWKIAGGVGVFFLVLYVALASLRAAGMWFDTSAEAGWPVILIMGLAFTAATGGLDEKNTERRA